MKKAMKNEQKPSKKRVRVSPAVLITLPPITLALGKAQAKGRGIPFSRHIRNLIERESNFPY